jgi:DNA-binding NtrC family response regulator
VRELENPIERLIVIAPQSTILPTNLPPEILDKAEKAAFELAMGQKSLQEACAEFEWRLYHVYQRICRENR